MILNIFALISSVVFLFFFSSEGEKEDYIKCELIDEGSPRFLLFVVYCSHRYMLCIVVIVNCTHVRHFVHYKISEHRYHSCCYC